MSPTRSIIQQLTKSPGLPKGGSGHCVSPAQTVTSRLAEARWSSDRVAELCSALEADGAKSASVVSTGIGIGVLWKAICEVYAGSRRTYYMPNSTVYFESKRFHEAVKGSNIVCVKTTRFGGDFGAFIITDDSPDKVMRKLTARINKLAESKQISESTWIQGLADELVDDGAKDAAVIRAPLAMRDLRKAAQLAYPDAVKTYFIPGSMEYSVDHRFHRRSVGAAVVVVQSEQHRDCAVFIITNDSPEKVGRKLAAAAAEGSV